MPVLIKEDVKGFVDELLYSVNEIMKKCDVDYDTVNMWIAVTGLKNKKRGPAIYLKPDMVHERLRYFRGSTIKKFLRGTGKHKYLRKAEKA